MFMDKVIVFAKYYVENLHSSKQYQMLTTLSLHKMFKKEFILYKAFLTENPEDRRLDNRREGPPARFWFAHGRYQLRQ